MKSLLSVTADTKAGDREVSGETLAIRGGRPLTGRVEVKGAKNLATKAMVAALLGETDERAARRPRHQRRAGRALAARGARCDASRTAKSRER